MFQSELNYKEYLNKLKKNELINLINDYNKLCDIYGYKKIEDTKSKKDVLIDLIDNVKENYAKGIIMSLDKRDYLALKEMVKKSSMESLNNNRALINFLKSKYILLLNDTLEIPKDIKLNEILKDKAVQKHIGYWTNVYDFVDGIIIAYGVVDISYFNELINDVKEKDNIFKMINFYYKKDYVVTEDRLISNKLSNKKRIDKYFKDKNYKKFTTKEYIALGRSLYHHNIKSYKKFIKMLKNYYVFKKNDIEFVDINIVIPYLYNKINEEDIAKNTLEETVVRLFEFKGDKLKEKMLTEIIKIRNEFPLWELRGFSKAEGNEK